VNLVKINKSFWLSILVFSLFVSALLGISKVEASQSENGDRSTELMKAVDESIQKTKGYYERNPFNYSTNNGSHSDFWMFSALWGAGYHDLKVDFPWNDAGPWTKGTYWMEGKENKASMANEEAGIIIGSLLLGMNPFQFGERDIVADLLERQQDSGMFSTIWGENWVLIALDLVDAEYDKEAQIEAILKNQDIEGSFGYSDPDATGWIMTALAPYMDKNEEVKKAINKAVEWAHDEFIENVEFPGMFGPNINSTSAVVMGLAAAGEDLYGEKWIKENSSLLEDLMGYQQGDGSFWWQKENAGAVSMATEQALLALATVNNGQSIFTNLKDQINIDDDNDSSNEDDSEEQPKNDVIQVDEKVENVDVKKGDTLKFKNSNSQVILPDDLPDGTKVTITIPDEKAKLPQEKDKILAGDLFDFIFKYPEGKEGYEGDFKLTLSVNDDVDFDDAEIYYFNEKNKEWKKIDAVNKDEENRTINVLVGHFSIYGVFVDAKENEEQGNNGQSGGSKQGSDGDNKVNGNGNGKGSGSGQNEGNGQGKGGNGQNKNNNNGMKLDNGNDAKKINETNRGLEKGEKLPKTATNLYNLMLFGVGLIILSVMILSIFRKRKINE